MIIPLSLFFNNSIQTFFFFLISLEKGVFCCCCFSFLKCINIHWAPTDFCFFASESQSLILLVCHVLYYKEMKCNSVNYPLQVVAISVDKRRVLYLLFVLNPTRMLALYLVLAWALLWIFKKAPQVEL